MNTDSKQPSQLENFEQILRYKIAVEYDGSNYCGFQKQLSPTLRSVEESLILAIFKLSGQKVSIFASGRTDAGVHAIEQTIHFDFQQAPKKSFLPRQLLLGLNHHLRGENIVVKSCEVVSQDFHARFCAKMRHYSYVIINRLAPPILEKSRAWHIPKPLNLLEMRIAADFLVGEHDFTSFRDQECQAKSPIRTISKISIERIDEKILITVSAKSFLHHMVRNIVGTLVYVGIGKISALSVPEILAAKNRQLSGPNAPASGLFFLRTDY